MPITILCPNNHKLTCPDSLAGKAGKCPHCGAKFKIPGPAVETKGAATAAAPAPAAAEAAAKPAAPEPETEPPGIRTYEAEGDAPPGDDDILFLCPEGHHLCGPATLAGETGECPVCNVKFIVPSPEEAVEPPEPELMLQELLAIAEAPQGYGFAGDEGTPRGIGALFAQLWKYRSLGCAVELHLGEGRVVVPSGFAPESAGLSHGLFTVSEPNGAATVSVIGWHTVERINVRSVQHLPRGVEFDIP